MYEYDTHQMVPPDAFVPDTGQPLGYPPDADPDSDSGAVSASWDLDSEFEQLFRPAHQYAAAPVEQEAHAAPPSRISRADRRRRRPRFIRSRLPFVIRIVITGTTAVVTTVISVCGAHVSYGALRDLASPTAHSLASSWPLLVYGPWSVACLSILHAAAHRRQARPAWLALLLFSAIAMAMCIADAPRNATAIAAAGLPPVSALVSFQLLFRQITLLHPRHAKVPRQRKH